MRMHSKVGLVTNSSSETFSFQTDMNQQEVNRMVQRLWLEFCINDGDFEDGVPTYFSVNNGWASYSVSMTNDGIDERFAEFVVERMRRPQISPVQNRMCSLCMANGLNSCPPCPY